jgi:hypothetical protein
VKPEEVETLGRAALSAANGVLDALLGEIAANAR